MHLSNSPPKTLHQLKHHKTAFIYHQQRLILPPTPQLQQTFNQSLGKPPGQQKHISPDFPLSIGNIFQDKITQLPVMHLPENHLLRIQNLRAIRLKGLQFPNSKKQEANENGRFEGQKRGGENQPSKIGIVYKKWVPFSNTRRLPRKNFHGFLTHNSSNNLSTETDERRQREQVVKNTPAKLVEIQQHHPAYSGKNGIEEGDVEIKMPIEMVVELDATSLATSNNAPDWPLRPSIEFVAWI